MTDKHTHTPWLLGGKDGDGTGADGFIYCDNKMGSAVAATSGEADFNYGTLPREEEIANAAHIVKCVNLHDELVEALAGMVECVNDLGFGTYHEEKWIIPAQAAIAKAKGETL